MKTLSDLTPKCRDLLIDVQVFFVCIIFFLIDKFLNK